MVKGWHLNKVWVFHLLHDGRLLEEVAQLHRVLLQQHHMLRYHHILISSDLL